MGAGDWAALHTRDGGRTWREVKDSFSHNDPTIVSFGNPSEGWVLAPNSWVNGALPLLLGTEDGGARWRRLPIPDDAFVGDIQYLGRGVGRASNYNPYTKQSDLYAIDEYGRRWTKRALPAGFRADTIEFADANRGILAGCLDDRVVSFATEDGGARWSKNIFDKSCEAAVDGLELSMDGRASLLVNKRSFGLNDLKAYSAAWQSGDWGRTWTEMFASQSSVPPAQGLPPLATGYAVVNGPVDESPMFSGLYRLANGTEIIVRQQDGKNALLWRRPGVKAWSATPVEHSVWDCRAFAGSLTCGSFEGFWLLTISPADAK